MLAKHRASVLVVEDEPLSRRLLVNTLKEEDCRVVVAESVEDAMTIIQAIRVDIVLSDIDLPGMSGIEFLRWIREQPRFTDIPVIMVTSAGDTAMQISFEAGAHDVINKPAKPRELVIRIAAAIRLSAAIEQRKEREQELELTLSYLQRDLAAASRLQRNVLPDQHIKLRGLQCSWYFSPCDELGGDLINYFPLNEREVALYIIDAAGHGISAALNTMAINSVIVSGQGRVGFLVDGNGRAAPPHVVLDNLNRRFQMDLDEGNYFTMTYCVVDCLDKTISYVQAGQPSGMVLKNSTLTALPGGGRPVGMLPDTEWETHKEHIEVGTRVLLYTDGVTDLAGPNGEVFGELRLQQTLSNHASDAFADFHEGIHSALECWADGVPKQDDVSFLLFEYLEDFEEHKVKVPATLEGVRELALQLRFLMANLIDDELLISRADLAITELGNNIAKHGYPSGAAGFIRARMQLSQSLVEVTLQDDGVPFNPLGGSETTIDEWTLNHAGEDSLSLGISIVRELVDEVHYESRDGLNHLCFKMYLDTNKQTEEALE